jgi:cell wall-associated NlpC family hydrolase
MEICFQQPYQVTQSLNLYDSLHCDRLATQATPGRQLRFLEIPTPVSGDPTFPQDNPPAWWVQLCEDDYPGWLASGDLAKLHPAAIPYQPVVMSRSDIEAKLPQILAFVQAALIQPNEYLWGGTIGPDYDCSGLMQAAFHSVGIWLPRDAYQQEAFVQTIELPPAADAENLASLVALEPGDLIFFGPSHKATHVGLYFQEGFYYHSSGKDQGRNGIGLDRLSAQGDPISQAYFAQLRGAGRIVKSYRSGIDTL